MKVSTSKEMRKAASHCTLLQTAMGGGESVARRAVELLQQRLYVQAALVIMQGGLLMLNVQDGCCGGKWPIDLGPAPCRHCGHKAS